MIIKPSELLSSVIRKSFHMCLMALGLLSILTFAAPRVALAESGADKGFTTNDEVECDWRSASIIDCADMTFGFDPVASVAGSTPHAIFKLANKGGNGSGGKENLDDGLDWYLHLFASDKGTFTNSATSANGASTQEITSDNQNAKQIELAIGGNPDNAKADPVPAGDEPDGADTKDPGQFQEAPERHLYEGKSHYALCGLYVRKNQMCYNTTSGGANSAGYQSPFNRYTTPNTPEFDAAMETVRSLIFGYIDSRDDCGRDAGSLSFILCPILETSKTAVAKLIGADGANGTGKGFLVELLTVTPLSGETDENLYKIWLAFRNIAMGIYVLIFIAIIFGNGLGLDPYTIKRALPRLATAVLLTFGSYFIVQTLVDLSNLAGTALPALISAITQNSGIVSFKIDFNTAEAGLTIILAIVVALAALVAVLVGIAGLIARQLVIFALVLISPLAFAAWVLPNTESLFKKWWSNLTKVLIMFPIITGMLAISLMFQAAVAGEQSLAVQLAGLLAPLIALTFIPKTFKWGGEVFAAGAGFIAGRASAGIDKAKGGGKALQGGVKNMAQNKIIQSDKRGIGGNSRLGGFLSGAGAGSLVNSRGGRLRRASNVSRIQNEVEKAASVRYDQVMSKAGTDEEKAKAFKQLVKGAGREEKFAFAAKAAKSGNMDHVGIAAANMKESEFAQFSARNYSDFDSMPDMRNQKTARLRGEMVAARGTSGHAAAQTAYRKQVASKIADKSSAAISGAKADAQKNMFYQEIYNVADGTVKADGAVDHDAIAAMDIGQLQNLITDKTLRGSLTKETLAAFTAHAYNPKYSSSASGAVLKAALEPDGRFKP